MSERDIRRELRADGVVDFYDDEERKIWLAVFARALQSPKTQGASGGTWVRGFATNCANYAVLALRGED
jgi:hypothetical protein